MTGCQSDISPVSETALPPIETPSLPSALPDVYIADFKQNPHIMASRFLSAYDDFSSSGPVTQQRVEDFIRLRAAFDRAQLFGQILTLDMDGDAHITAEEVNLALSLPGWSTKPAAIERIIESDENEDGIITLEEASRHSRVLYAQAHARSTPPVGNYLMLADLNEDGIVTRQEMTIYLNRFVTRS